MKISWEKKGRNPIEKIFRVETARLSNYMRVREKPRLNILSTWITDRLCHF